MLITTSFQKSMKAPPRSRGALSSIPKRAIATCKAKNRTIATIGRAKLNRTCPAVAWPVVKNMYVENRRAAYSSIRIPSPRQHPTRRLAELPIALNTFLIISPSASLVLVQASAYFTRVQSSDLSYLEDALSFVVTLDLRHLALTCLPLDAEFSTTVHDAVAILVVRHRRGSFSRSIDL